MLRLDAEAFYNVIGHIHRVEIALERGEKDELSTTLGEASKKTVREGLEDMCKHARLLRAEVTALTINDLLESLPDENMTWERIGRGIYSVRHNFRREMSLTCLFVVEREKAGLIDPQEPLFGQQVFDRFPAAIDDVAEAGKCLALQRGTATVFHLMRVMEVGLRALGTELGIPYAPSWESYIRQLDALLDGKNYSQLTDEQKKKRTFYQEALGDLVAVKSAWRNPTMHIVRSYDAQQASRVFDAVKALMENLAKELKADPSLVIATGQSVP